MKKCHKIQDLKMLSKKKKMTIINNFESLENTDISELIYLMRLYG